ncbi:synaptic vesicle 2-related protein-like isoform X1 [Porites lutea]|uniref:synaptic vesicle 2-related protein-like isoform X1 n=1 Tax=Porites lutea TaxID=51062 RepID=UPI003CC6B46C
MMEGSEGESDEFHSDMEVTFSKAKSRSPQRQRLEEADELSEDVFMPLVPGDEFEEQDLEDSGQPTYTLSEAVEKIGFGKFQMNIIWMVGFFVIADALEMMLLSILAPTIRCIWHLPSWKEALVTTVVFVGMMIGSSFWGWLADHYGRKTVIVICATWIFYFGLISSFSPHYYWIIALRCLVGFGIGGAPQSTTLLAEFLPSSVRSYCILSLSFFWAIGSCFTVGVAMAVMPSLGWRWLLGFLSLPLLLFVAMSYWLPESCRYYLAAGEKEKAVRMLQKVARVNKSEMPVGILKDASENGRQGQFKDLISPEFRKTTILLWFIWFNLAFTYYGIVLMTTEMYQGLSESEGSCGATDSGAVKNPDCGCQLLTFKDYTDMLWTTLAEFPGIIVTMLMLEKLGRKKTMAIEFFLTSVCYFLLFICSGRTMMTVFIFGVRGFISGAFQGFYVYTPEVYPTVVRALGLGFCSAVARVGAMITPFISQVLLRVSLRLALGVYGLMSLLCTVCTLLLPIETTGRPMVESMH